MDKPSKVKKPKSKPKLPEETERPDRPQEPEFIESIENLQNSQANMLVSNQKFLRGEILALTVQIERKIDSYLSNYFCGNIKKRNELNELLLYTEKITLDMKRQIFVHLLKSNKSEFPKSNPEFLKYLEEIVPHRNVFAHLEIMDMRDLPFEDRRKLVFKKYNSGALNPKKYTMDDIVDIQTKMMYIDFTMGIILQELPPLPDSIATKS